MADVKELKVITLPKLQEYNEQKTQEIQKLDEAILEQSKQYAKEYADGLAPNYDASGTAATKVQELANGQVKENQEAIAKLNGDENTEGSVDKKIKDAKALIDADIDAVEEKADNAQKAADDAQADVDALEPRVKTVEDKVGVLEGDENTEGSVKKAVKDAKDEVKAEIGNLEELETTSKDDLVDAINEVRNTVSAGGVAAAVTIETTTTTEGMLKSYTVKQGDQVIGVIDIPKELMAVSGQIVENPEGLDAGTYIELTIQNGDPVYINVASLIDNYKAQENATQIQLAIDAETRTISATIVAGSVGTTELADGAIVTVKIADGNVTKVKLSTAVQASLDKADTAVQNVSEGSTNGTVSVDGNDVAVKGLGSSAFTDASAYDAAGTAQTKVQELAEGQVQENTDNIVELQNKVSVLESTTIVEATSEDISAMFPSTTE